MSNLQPTYGNFKVRGIITGISKENAYVQETSKRTGTLYRRLRFSVKTSPTNTVQLEMMGSEMKELMVWNRDTKEKKYVPWAKRYNHGMDGFSIFGVTLGLEKDASGKNVSKLLAPFDAAEALHKDLQEGDSVIIMGRMNFSEYEDKQGNTQTQLRYEIQRVYRATTDVDLDSDEEVADFKQEIIVADSFVEAGKLQVNTHIVTDKNGTFVSYPFVVDGADERLKGLFNNIKKFKFGTSLVVEGKIRNQYETKTVEVEATDDWGLPSSFEKQVITNVVKELQITRGDASTLKEKRYKEEDFVQDNWGVMSSLSEEEELPFNF